MPIPGSQYLSLSLHVLAQSLLIPVILGLLYFSGRVLLELGSLLGEWKQRRQRKACNLPIAQVILMQKGNDKSGKHSMPEMAERILQALVGTKTIVNDTEDVLARKLLETEEDRAIQVLSKTDTIVKLGPMLGLMGTLIPLGPGLAALSNGDMKSLAQAVILAFDTTLNQC